MRNPSQLHSTRKAVEPAASAWSIVTAIALVAALPMLSSCADDDDGRATDEAPNTTQTAEPSDLIVDPDAPPLEAWSASGPHRADRFNITITDPVRTLLDRDGNEVPRQLDTAVWHPDESVEPRPLLVWAHGLGSTREDSPRVARAMASRGWIVAAPNFPRTSRSSPDRDLADVLNQPGDVSLVIDHMLQRNADPGDTLHNTIDPERIAVGGVSLGGLTSLVATWTSDYRDDRIGAVIALGAPACYMPRPFFDGPPVPMLVIHGDADAVVDYETHGQNVFASPPGPSIVTRFLGGSHIGMADNYGGLLESTPQPDVVACTSIGDSLSPEELAALSESIGGPDAATLNAECRHPCSGDELDRVAMNSRRQTDLILHTCVAFLSGVFDEGPTIGTLAAMLDAEPDIDARAFSRLHSSPSSP